MPTPEHSRSSPKKSPAVFRWGLFIGFWVMIGYIWLALLPRHSALEKSEARWAKWKASGIDPSATWYSELERHSTILSHWKERKAAPPERTAKPVRHPGKSD